MLRPPVEFYANAQVPKSNTTYLMEISECLIRTETI